MGALIFGLDTHLVALGIDHKATSSGRYRQTTNHLFAAAALGAFDFERMLLTIGHPIGGAGLNHFARARHFLQDTL